MCIIVSLPMPISAPENWIHTARTLTEAAACACVPWIGAGDKQAADAAAVEALRTTAAAGALRGTVVIGEGEKDDAPYLAPGESIGPAHAQSTVDVAVDPLEGTRLVATDAPGALAVLALAPAGSILPLGRAFYMEKLIGPPAAHNALDLDAPPAEVANAVAAALACPVADLRIAVQERPRHTALVRALREAGAHVSLFGDGDLSYAIQALQPRTHRSTNSVDLLWGTGGAPEGVLAAAAQRVVGGAMQLRLAPRSETERSRLRNDPALPDVLGRILTANSVVRTGPVAMACTGITTGPLLKGVRTVQGEFQTETLVLGTGALPRRVVTDQSFSFRPGSSSLG